MTRATDIARRLPFLYQDGAEVRRLLATYGLQLSMGEEAMREVQRAHFLDRTLDLDEAAALTSLINMEPEQWQGVREYRAYAHGLRDAILHAGAVTRQAIGPDKLMIANILRARFKNGGLEYMDYFDGSYLENFFHNVGKASYEEYVAKGIEAMQKAARQGKIIAFTTGLAASKNKSKMGIDEGHSAVQSDQQARAALAYPLGIFLICAEKYSYFRVHEGYAADGNNRWMRWFPEFNRPLGPPRGPAKKDGYRYTRTFEHASVTLDIKKRTAKIKWLEPKSEIKP